MVLDRRPFLRTGVAGFGSIMLRPSCFRQGSPYQFFTPEEAACVIALCEQIIPESNLISWENLNQDNFSINYIYFPSPERDNDMWYSFTVPKNMNYFKEPTSQKVAGGRHLFLLYLEQGTARLDAIKSIVYGGTLPSGWSYFAQEYQQCSFFGTSTNGVICANSVFGDPIVSADKFCYYRDVALDTTPPA